MPLLQYKAFKKIDLEDDFFCSLKKDYSEFVKWFNKKSNNNDFAYVFDKNTKIVGFLYLKEETGPIVDIDPVINAEKVLKVGTMKIEAHGTKMGERFIKKIVDNAIERKIEKIYVTVFKRHENLIALYKKYGFYEYGKKVTGNGEEVVLLKDMKLEDDNILKIYPKVKINKGNKYLLGILPKYHTRLFPDSKLNNENYDLIKDVSHTNSIHKIYVCRMGVNCLKRGDVLLIYRTTDQYGLAKYRSVVTSICVVEDVKTKNDFSDFNEFYNYSNKYSVFDKNDLQWCYKQDKCYIIKMTYNVAFNRRVNKKVLTDEIGFNPNYWGFAPVTDEKVNAIIEKGEVDESFIVNKA